MPGATRWTVAPLISLLLLAAAAEGHAEEEDAAAEPADGRHEQLSDYYTLFQSHYEVTTASKVAISSADAPAVITVIPRATILARGYRTVGEALMDVPGLFGIDDLVTVNLGVRGVSPGTEGWSRIIKFMINGHPVTFEATGGVVLGPEFLPIDTVKAIEVIRGPGSALYGANAFLGVVNIITRPYEEGSPALVATGEGMAIRNRAGYGGEVTAFAQHVGQANASLLVAALAQHVDRSGLIAPATAPAAVAGKASRNDLSMPLGAFMRGVWSAPYHLGQWTLQAVYQRTDANNEFGTIQTLSHDTRLVMQNIVAHVENLLHFGTDDMWSVRTFLGYAFDEDLPQERLDTGEPLTLLFRQRSNTALRAGTELSVALPSVYLLAGVDLLNDENVGDTVYRGSRVATGIPSPRLDLSSTATTLRTTNFAGYGQAVVQLPWVPNLGLTGGLRYDHNSKYASSFSWRGAASYKFSSDFTAKVMYGSSFVPPAPVQLTAVALRSSDSIIGNLALQPQRAGTLEAAVSYTPHELVEAQINLFWTNIYNRIEYINNYRAQQGSNLTQSNTVGAEIMAELHWRALVVQANASLALSQVEPLDPSPSWFDFTYGTDRPDQLMLPGYPSAMGHLSARLTYPEYYFELSATAHVIGRRYSTVDNIVIARQSTFLSTYATLDFNVRTLGVTLGPGGPQADISLHAVNVTGTQYYQPGALGTDIPGLGRQFYLRARIAL